MYKNSEKRSFNNKLFPLRLPLLNCAFLTGINHCIIISSFLKTEIRLRNQDLQQRLG